TTQRSTAPRDFDTGVGAFHALDPQRTAADRRVGALPKRQPVGRRRVGGSVHIGLGTVVRVDDGVADLADAFGPRLDSPHGCDGWRRRPLSVRAWRGYVGWHGARACSGAAASARAAGTRRLQRGA